MSGGAIDGIVRVKVLFFAKARELAGLRESELVLPADVTSSELKARVLADFNLESIKDVVNLAVNEEFVEPDIKLSLTEKDEIAVIPPLSGGTLLLLLLNSIKYKSFYTQYQFSLCI